MEVGDVKISIVTDKKNKLDLQNDNNSFGFFP